jgi:hypothetical protein
MNHLMIGLGGTGGRVLRSLRKLSYQQFRGEDPDDVALEYLFVDSDPKSFSDADPSWSVLGKSVHLAKRNQLLIAEANLGAVIQDLNSHPNLRPWLGDRTAWGEILASLNIDAAGGQKRRLGRFLMSMNMQKFRNSVSTLVRDMQERGKRGDICFHVFCGLAGGTGSGALPDVIAQLRQMFPDKSQRIVVYAYLPDLNPPPNWNTGNYHANAYAALLELNAMSAGAWAPLDVQNGQGPVKSDFWFNGCYVFSDENDQGFRASIETELPEIVADFVFHKTVVARKVSWDDLTRFENSENGDAGPEAVAGTGKGLRSVRFLSFGMRRLAFPEDTIREYLTYEFALQSLRQLRFNNWQDGVGYVDLARPSANAEFVAEPKTRDEWRLSDDHLRLVRPILDSSGSKKWKSYEKEWMEYETHYLQLAKQNDKLKWLNELKVLFVTAWNEGFRSSGVSQFFQTAERDCRNMATSIRDRVETSLMDDWRNGVRSLHDCGRIVASLIDDVDARAAKVDDFVLKRGQSAEHLNGQFLAVEAEWSKLRVLGAVTGSRERDLSKAALLLREMNAARTWVEAGRFSKKLIAELTEQLNDLKSSIDLGESALGTAMEQAAKIMADRKSSSEKGEFSHSSGYVVRIEDAKAIEAVRRKLVVGEDEQRVQTSAVRAEIISRLGQQPTFRVFTRRMAEAEIRNAIVAKCESNIESAHSRLVTEAHERVLGVSVMDKLQDRWGTDEDLLTREASALAASAGRFITFDPTEQNKHFEGRSVSPRATEAFAALMPEPAELKGFVDQLKKAFRSARPGRVSFVAANERMNEITLVTLVNLFPLRYVRTVKALREHYVRRIAQMGRERGALEIHIEGDGLQFPDLFIADDVQIARRARIALLMAEALNIAVEVKNDGTGQVELRLLRKDSDGFDLEPVTLGKNFDDAAEQMGERMVMELKTGIAEALIPRAPRGVEGQTELRDRMLARVNTLKSTAAPHLVAAVSQRWSDAARDAMKFLRRESDL